jgi:hypothetical protein
MDHDNYPAEYKKDPYIERTFSRHKPKHRRQSPTAIDTEYPPNPAADDLKRLITERRLFQILRMAEAMRRFIIVEFTP